NWMSSIARLLPHPPGPLLRITSTTSVLLPVLNDTLKYRHWGENSLRISPVGSDLMSSPDVVRISNCRLGIHTVLLSPHCRSGGLALTTHALNVKSVFGHRPGCVSR